MNKMYGVKEPKLLDYLLAAVIALISVSALLVGIWVTAAKAWDPANAALASFVDALKFNFQGNLAGVLAAQSVLIYGGFALAICLCIKVICQKAYRAIPGVVAIAIAGCALALGIGFFANAIGAMSGVFVVALALMLLVLMYAAKKVVKVTITTLLYYGCECECEDECECGEECHCHEEAKEEPKPEPKPEPKKVKPQPKEEVVFENSNGYKEEFEDYNKNVEEMAEDDKNAIPFDRKENNFTFEQKLKRAQKIAREYYKDLKKEFEAMGFKSAMTKAGETFIYKNKKYAMIDVAGQKGLKVYFKLDYADYEESPIPVKFKGDVKKYENVPVLLVVKSNLAVKRAKKLMQDVKDKYGV